MPYWHGDPPGHALPHRQRRHPGGARFPAELTLARQSCGSGIGLVRPRRPCHGGNGRIHRRYAHSGSSRPGSSSDEWCGERGPVAPPSRKGLDRENAVDELRKGGFLDRPRILAHGLPAFRDEASAVPSTGTAQGPSRHAVRRSPGQAEEASKGAAPGFSLLPPANSRLPGEPGLRRQDRARILRESSGCRRTMPVGWASRKRGPEPPRLAPSPRECTFSDEGAELRRGEWP